MLMSPHLKLQQNNLTIQKELYFPENWVSGQQQILSKKMQGFVFWSTLFKKTECFQLKIRLIFHPKEFAFEMPLHWLTEGNIEAFPMLWANSVVNMSYVVLAMMPSLTERLWCYGRCSSNSTSSIKNKERMHFPLMVMDFLTRHSYC